MFVYPCCCADVIAQIRMGHVISLCAALAAGDTVPVHRAPRALSGAQGLFFCVMCARVRAVSDARNRQLHLKENQSVIGAAMRSYVCVWRHVWLTRAYRRHWLRCGRARARDCALLGRARHGPQQQRVRVVATVTRCGLAHMTVCSYQVTRATKLTATERVPHVNFTKVRNARDVLCVCIRHGAADE